MFSRKKKTDVLVVGAGPSGLMTALLLARAGVEVTVVDQAWRAAGRSYAAALHPSTLALLDEVGLLREVLAAAHRVDRVALYDNERRRASVDLAQLPGPYPFVAVLPQSRLEAILEAELTRLGHPVLWLHRVGGWTSLDDRVVVEVDVLESVPGGYAVAASGTEVVRTLDVEALLLIGADGYRSLVRRRLGIDYESWGARETYDVFEFESDDDAAGEVRVVLGERTTNVLWSLPNGRQRWSFQVASAGPERERVKSRLMMAVPGESSPRFGAEVLEQLVRERAPWFEAKLGDIAWAGDVSFEPRLAQHLGDQRVWLVGDAAHQSLPVGVQSMNIGLLEARRLAESIPAILTGRAPLTSLAGYEAASSAVWCRLLGIQPLFEPGPDANEWTRALLDRMVPCLPANGEELALLARQLGLQVVGDE